MLPLNLTKVLHGIRTMGRQAWLEKQLNQAFFEARRGKTKTVNENLYETNHILNTVKLAQTIMDKTYRPSPSITFVIRDPMIREIFAAPFRDRIVHHFIYNITAGWWDQCFINDSYSCRLGKGTLYGIKRLQTQMREAKKEYRKAHIVKLDLKGYFMSLNRKKLYHLAQTGLKEQFKPYQQDIDAQWLYEICRFLWEQTIFDDPIKNVRRKGSIHDWDDLPPEKSLFGQKPGVGIVIGNLTSQLLSNIMLNQLDHYVTEYLGYKYYGRYVDDFYLIVADSDYEHFKKVDLHRIENFLMGLGLTLHPKKRYMQPVERGVQFLNARVYLNCLYPSDRLQAKFKRAMQECIAGQRDIDSLIAYLGLMHHLDAKRFVKKVFEANGQDYRFY